MALHDVRGVCVRVFQEGSSVPPPTQPWPSPMTSYIGPGYALVEGGAKEGFGQKPGFDRSPSNLFHQT